MSDDPQNSGRDERGLWTKGTSGNPGGRPKGHAEVRRLAVEGSPAAMRKLLWLVEHGETHAIQRQAAVDVLAYGIGKPLQMTMDMTPAADDPSLTIAKQLRDAMMEALAGGTELERLASN